MALTEQGYHRPTYNEILESKIQTAKELFGEDIETNDQTPLGKFIRIGAYDLAKAYEDLEATYYARFPNTASGVSLDRLCVFVGISRNPATFAERTITVYGDKDTEVEEIKVCGENGEITFHNIEAFIIPEGGSIDITVQCDTAGTVGNVYDINEVVNPIVGVNSVAYKGSIDDTDGEDTESDYDLRNRFAQAVEGLGASNASSIRTAILRLPTVKSVSVIENSGDTQDANGRPPHSFECYVYGGEDYQQDIAQAIYDKKPLGITACSTSQNPVTKTIIDEGGTTHTIKFSHTEDIPVYINISYKKNTKFEENGEEQIKSVLTEYINNLGVGADVILSALYGFIYGVEGISDITSLTIGTASGTTTISNISVEAWQVAVTDFSKITLTEVA